MHIPIEKRKEKKKRERKWSSEGKNCLQTCERREDQDKLKQVSNMLNA